MENILFKNPEVRMLANAIFGNALFSTTYGDEKTNNSTNEKISYNDVIDQNLSPIFHLDDYYKKWLFTLDDNPKSLIEWVGDEKQKLGIYHEKLWQFFLKNNGKTELISHNLKVKGTHNDIGEFDIIYSDNSKKLFHLEIANKYYLCINEDSKSLSNWVGPNKIDSLEKKINHTLNKQIKLSDTIFGEKEIECVIRKKNKISLIDQPVVKQIQIGGRLFYPNSSKKSKHRTPNLINSNHNKGSWLTLSEWEIKNNQLDIAYIILNKPFWLDYIFHEKDFSSGKKKLIKLSNDQPKMIFFKSNDDQKGSYAFIVPDKWLST